MTNEDIQREALAIVRGEVTKYQDAQFFVTEKVSFVIRPLVRLLRKNYWGVFDEPKDPITGRKKVFAPFTALVVNSVRKNSDMDSKDVNFRSNNGREGIPITSLVRAYVKEWMRKSSFGEALNDLILTLCIDGTVVWKTFTHQGKLIRTQVDLLNVYIDPTADSIQSAPRFTERALMEVDEVKAMDGWMNTDEVTANAAIHRTERDLFQVFTASTMTDVYETWGLIPEKLITGKDDDKKMIEGHIVVSGLDGSASGGKVHLIERNTNKDKDGNIIKPYEECRYIKVPGRWYGLGPAEMILMLQEWINIIVNLRINKNTNASLGLFKVKKGSGITQQMLSNLVSRGVIQLANMDDLDNFQIDEAGAGSYKDEDVAKQWGFEVTSTFDISRGAPMPSTATATGAVIEDRNAKTAFVLVREAVGLFLERWFDRHALPAMVTGMKKDKKVRFAGDLDDIEKIRTRVVSYLAMQKLDEMQKQGVVPTEEELTVSMDEAMQRLRDDKDLFMEVVGDIVASGLDTKVYFTNEEMDVGVTVSNLLQMAQVIPDPDAQRDFVIQGLDLLGLEVPESLRSRKVAQMPQDGMAPAKPSAPVAPGMSDQPLVTDANAYG